MRPAREPWGSDRNGLPAAGRYVHPGWVDGRPSAADNPPRDGSCGKCGGSRSSQRHRTLCLGLDPVPATGPDPEQCGTVQGYRLHLALGQAADPACLAAWALASRLDRARTDPTKCQSCGFKDGSKKCAAWHEAYPDR
jgi:hypothetical protein